MRRRGHFGAVDPYLLLALAEGGEPGLVRELLEPGSDPARRLQQPPPLRPRALARLLDPELPARAERLLGAATALGLLVLTPADPRYPPRLQHTALRPNALFARGDPRALAAAPPIALVASSSRTPTGRG